MYHRVQCYSESPNSLGNLSFLLAQPTEYTDEFVCHSWLNLSPFVSRSSDSFHKIIDHRTLYELKKESYDVVNLHVITTSFEFTGNCVVATEFSIIGVGTIRRYKIRRF